jgi:hypothetical protein
LAFQLELIQSDYQAIYGAAHQVVQGIGFLRFGLTKAFRDVVIDIFKVIAQTASSLRSTLSGDVMKSWALAQDDSLG